MRSLFLNAPFIKLLSFGLSTQRIIFRRAGIPVHCSSQLSTTAPIIPPAIGANTFDFLTLARQHHRRNPFFHEKHDCTPVASLGHGPWHFPRAKTPRPTPRPGRRARGAAPIPPTISSTIWGRIPNRWTACRTGSSSGRRLFRAMYFPGTQHTYWVYVPAQYDPATAHRRNDFQRRPGDDGRAGRRAGAICFGQLDLSPRNTGDAGRLYQSRPAARPAGTERRRIGATGRRTAPTNTIRPRTNTPGSLWMS